MGTPRQNANPNVTPEHDRAQALRRAARSSAKRERAEADEILAFRIAAVAGASTRDIAAATGRSQATVARMIRRAPETD